MNHTDLDFLLTHFDQHSLFPRKMMTLKSNGQFTVNSREEILIKCEQSNFEDCRINAYPEFTNYKGIVRQPPNFVFIDLDISNFSMLKEPRKALERALRSTLKTMSIYFQKPSQISQPLMRSQDIFNEIDEDRGNDSLYQIRPTVLWTGNGYHVYLPIQGLILDQYDTFSPTKYPRLFSPTKNGKYTGWSISELFLKFCSVFFSLGKADPQHHPKFKTCLVRIPNSLNSKCLSRGMSKPESQVKIIQKWNGYRPPIQLITKDFRRWLMQNELDEIFSTKQKIKTKFLTCPQIYSSTSIQWIEVLLRTPLEDKRKYCLYRILIPYLKNVKLLDEITISSILKTWLDTCAQIRKLDFDPKYQIKANLKNVKNYRPISFFNLKHENPYLYNLVKA